MSIKKNVQSSLISFTYEFINFYYNALNTRNFRAINHHLKDYTTYSIEKIHVKGSSVMEYLNNLITAKNLIYEVIDFDTLHSGSRRINLLVTGKVRFIDNNIPVEKLFTEYLHISKDKKSCWIVSSIFKLI